MRSVVTAVKRKSTMKRAGLGLLLTILAVIGAFAVLSASPAAFAADLGGYTGPDAQYVLMKQLPQPPVKAGFKFKVGYLNGYAGINELMTIQNECEKTIKALGGTMIAYDGQLDIQKQVSQMDQLIAQKVDVIVAYPATESALIRGTAAAKAAGIPVIMVNTPSNSELPVDPNAAATVGMAFDLYDYATVKYIAQKHPKAKVAFLGFGPPAENLTHIVGRTKYWAGQMGLTVLGQVDAVDPSPGAASTATQGIFGKYPDVQVILTYNDYTSMAAAAALKASGKTGVMVGSPNGGEEVVAQGIKAGTILCAYRDPWEKVGIAAGIAAYDALTKRPIPAKRMLFLGDLATKETVDKLTFVH